MFIQFKIVGKSLLSDNMVRLEAIVAEQYGVRQSGILILELHKDKVKEYNIGDTVSLML